MVGRVGSSRRSQPRHMQTPSASFCVPQIILKLLVEPTLRTGIEGDGETDGHLWADARTPIKDAGKRFTTDSERSCDLRDGQVQGIQAQSLEYFTRMRRIVHFHNDLSGSLRNRHGPHASGHI
jgi:hypothetical protein